jgi:large subunit ribosomal protein L17
MRHRKKGRKLNRTASHRKALMRNLANQLIEHKEIKTTTAKAKEARSTVERLITYAKKGDLHHRRLAFRFLRNKESIKILFDELAPAFAEREGGYTRVLKLGTRQGDAASIAMLQLVGFEKLADSSKPEKKKKSRKKDTVQDTETTEATVAEEQEVPEVQEAEVVEEASPEEQQPVEEEKKAEEPVEEEDV